MEYEKLLDHRQYAWDYFLAHAQARLTTFRFFLFYCSAIFAGMLFSIKIENLWIMALLSLLLFLISWIYQKVDIRHNQMIKRSQEALIEIEGMFELEDIGDNEPNKLKLFTREKYVTSKMVRFPKSLSKDAHISYSTSVNIVFFIFKVFGLISCLGILIYKLNWFHYLIWTIK